jgi:vancomycin permeability regulator SanA
VTAVSEHNSRGFGACLLKFPWSLKLEAWSFIPRGLALFLGGFSLLNLLGHFRSARFDANLWWIDLHWFPQRPANVFLLVCSLFLFGFGIQFPRSAWRRWLTLGGVAALGAVALVNAAQFYTLLARGVVATDIPIPLSLFIGAALALILVATLRPSPPARFLPALAVCVACIAVFPLAQMFCFGKTDYRRPADIAVVLGARAYADGRPSQALADRVRTACRLYQDGLVGKLVFSGGPGDGTVHETEAMKQMALRLGVNEYDIILDKEGLNTQATVKNTEALFSQLHAGRILVVSHFYHLPRIKLAYQRDGWNVYTVPAKESYLLGQLPYNMAREVAALWVYYLRPLAAGAQSSNSARG